MFLSSLEQTALLRAPAFTIGRDLRLNPDFAVDGLTNVSSRCQRGRCLGLYRSSRRGRFGLRGSGGGGRCCGSRWRRSSRHCLRYRDCWCEHQANCDQSRSQLLHYLFVQCCGPDFRAGKDSGTARRRRSAAAYTRQSPTAQEPIKLFCAGLPPPSSHLIGRVRRFIVKQAGAI